MNKEELRTVALSFDAAHPDWPEHEHEGLALFKFFLEKLGIKDDIIQAEEKRYLEELTKIQPGTLFPGYY